MRSPPAIALTPPQHIRREVHSDRVLFKCSWRRRHLWFIIPFTLFWDGFLFMWYATAFTQPDTPLMMILFPIFHVIIGLGLTYFCVASLLNTTEVEVSPDVLRVTTAPMRWTKEVRIAPAEIRDVVYFERANKGYASRYDVTVLNQQGGQQPLIRSISDYEEAVFFVREIRSLLSLPDTPLTPDI